MMRIYAEQKLPLLEQCCREYEIRTVPGLETYGLDSYDFNNRSLRTYGSGTYSLDTNG